MMSDGTAHITEKSSREERAGGPVKSEIRACSCRISISKGVDS
jgi:hypothetical protein